VAATSQWRYYTYQKRFNLNRKYVLEVKDARRTCGPGEGIAGERVWFEPRDERARLVALPGIGGYCN
jgi:hypothetical protein